MRLHRIIFAAFLLLALATALSSVGYADTTSKVTPEPHPQTGRYTQLMFSDMDSIDAYEAVREYDLAPSTDEEHAAWVRVLTQTRDYAVAQGAVPEGSPRKGLWWALIKGIEGELTCVVSVATHVGQTSQDAMARPTVGQAQGAAELIEECHKAQVGI